MKSSLFDKFNFTLCNFFDYQILRWVRIVLSGRLVATWLCVVGCSILHWFISLRYWRFAGCLFTKLHAVLFLLVAEFITIGGFPIRGELLHLRSCGTVAAAVVVVFHTNTLILLRSSQISNPCSLRINHFVVLLRRVDSRSILSLSWHVPIITLFIRCLKCVLWSGHIFSGPVIGIVTVALAVAVLAQFLHVHFFLLKFLLIRLCGSKSVGLSFETLSVGVVATAHWRIFVTH